MLGWTEYFNLNPRIFGSRCTQETSTRPTASCTFEPASAPADRHSRIRELPFCFRGGDGAGLHIAGALPRDRHREEECVETGIVEAFTEIAPGGQNQSRFLGRYN
jgi:hypothetical protein